MGNLKYYNKNKDDVEFKTNRRRVRKEWEERKRREDPEYWAQRMEKIRQRANTTYKARIAASNKAYRERKKSDPEYVAKAALRGEQWKLRKYNLTQDQFREMEVRQNYLCAICKKSEEKISTRTGTPNKLNVDHDHTTGKVRGLLCARCNCGLGYFQEDTAIMHGAIAYVKSFESLK